MSFQKRLHRFVEIIVKTILICWDMLQTGSCIKLFTQSSLSMISQIKYFVHGSTVSGMQVSFKTARLGIISWKNRFMLGNPKQIWLGKQQNRKFPPENNNINTCPHVFQNQKIIKRDIEYFLLLGRGSNFLLHFSPLYPKGQILNRVV